MSKLDPHWAVITGAAGGIGRALCEAFSDEGYRVIATDVKPRTDVVCDEFLECDLIEYCDSSETREAVYQAIGSVCGDAGVRCLVNNAAVQRLASTGSIAPEDIRDTLHVNLVAPLLLAQAMLPLLEQAEGSVVNVGSVHEWSTKPGFVIYAASKAAIGGLTRSLAVDLGGRVRVNSVTPGAVDTPMLREGFSDHPEMMQRLVECQPSGRIAEPRDVAKAAVFLASESAGAITGSSLRIDGGILARLHDPA